MVDLTIGREGVSSGREKETISDSSLTQIGGALADFGVLVRMMHRSCSLWILDNTLKFGFVSSYRRGGLGPNHASAPVFRR